MDNQLILEKQDLRHLVWSKWRKSSGTTGSFLKSYSELGGHKLYYKLSDYDPLLGVVGHECVNELIVDRLLTILGIEHLRYQIIHASILVDGKRRILTSVRPKTLSSQGKINLLWTSTML